MIVKILGTGCPNCKRLENNTKEAVKGLGIEAEIIKVEDIQEIVACGVMSLPALVIDGKVVLSGQILSASEIKKIIKSENKNKEDGKSKDCCCCNGDCC